MLGVEIVSDGIEHGASHRVARRFRDNAHNRFVESFLGLIILYFLRKRGLSNYELLEVTYRKLGIKLSLETIDLTLYSLLHKSLISPNISAGRTIYTLTQQGLIYTHLLYNTSEGNYSQLRETPPDLNAPEVKTIQK